MCFSTEFEICDKSAKNIKEELERALNNLAGNRNKNVLVYFMGYTKTVIVFFKFIVVYWTSHATHGPILSARHLKFDNYSLAVDN